MGELSNDCQNISKLILREKLNPSTKYWKNEGNTLSKMEQTSEMSHLQRLKSEVDEDLHKASSNLAFLMQKVSSRSTKNEKIPL